MAGTETLRLVPSVAHRVHSSSRVCLVSDRLNTGDLFTVKGFTKKGDLQLDNGWELPREYGHLSYGLVVTSHDPSGDSRKLPAGQSAGTCMSTICRVS